MSRRPGLDGGRYREVAAAMAGLRSVAVNAGLDPALLELVKVRVSQINGCGFCIDMHTKDARVAGETEQRLYLLNTWREVSMYSAREKAALAWCEAVARLEHHGVSNEVYDEARTQFNENELIGLTMATIEISGWNRLALAFRLEAGTYQPRKAPTAEVAGQ